MQTVVVSTLVRSLKQHARKNMVGNLTKLVSCPGRMTVDNLVEVWMSAWVNPECVHSTWCWLVYLTMIYSNGLPFGPHHHRLLTII
ncbi:hypothetical protein OUZ56_020712 [Daphnia magna]|uniref:Uncharacterized protein n=1 Tax=Daphnia magna TaxID=35525 RepID=A0ABQ9ZF94_9CRUS|nr:hypothetical protein OUZ56_020712 [Daphnia magna]